MCVYIYIWGPNSSQDRVYIYIIYIYICIYIYHMYIYIYVPLFIYTFHVYIFVFKFSSTSPCADLYPASLAGQSWECPTRPLLRHVQLRPKPSVLLQLSIWAGFWRGRGYMELTRRIPGKMNPETLQLCVLCLCTGLSTLEMTAGIQLLRQLHGRGTDLLSRLIQDDTPED